MTVATEFVKRIAAIVGGRDAAIADLSAQLADALANDKESEEAIAVANAAAAEARARADASAAQAAELEAGLVELDVLLDGYEAVGSEAPAEEPVAEAPVEEPAAEAPAEEPAAEVEVATEGE